MKLKRVKTPPRNGKRFVATWLGSESSLYSGVFYFYKDVLHKVDCGPFLSSWPIDVEFQIVESHQSLFIQGYKSLNQRSQGAGDSKADMDLPDITREQMSIKLKKSQKKGKGGWWDEERCTINSLREKLRSAVDENKMIDIINYAAMIHFREQASETES